MSVVIKEKCRPITAKFSEMPTGRVDIDAAVSSSEYFQAEKEGIFKKSWLMVGRESEVENIGDYIVRTIDTLDTSVIITRNKQNKINAFHNVCVHRGMTLCGKNEKAGNKKYFNCPFHGWVYDADGTLVDVPDRQFFAEEDLAGLSLAKINLDTWEGFIFINIDSNPGESLQDYLGELYEGYEGYFDDNKFKLVNRYIMDGKFNWKFYVDSSVEAYHASCVHIQNNTGQNAKSGTILHVAPEAVKLFNRHRVLGLPSGFGERDLSPIEGLSYQYGAITPYDTKIAGSDMPPAINANKDPAWAFDIVEFFPNIILFVSAPLYAIISVWPSSEKKCLHISDVYMAEPKNAAERVALEYGMLSLRDVIREDVNTAEGSTTMTKSGALKEYIFSDQEIAVRHNYKKVDEAVQAWLARKG